MFSCPAQSRQFFLLHAGKIELLSIALKLENYAARQIWTRPNL